MLGQMIAVSQTQYDLSHLGGIAHFVAPVGRARLADRANGRFVIREQARRILICARSPVRSHSAGFERAHLYAKGRYFLGESLGKSADRPLSCMVCLLPGRARRPPT